MPLLQASLGTDWEDYEYKIRLLMDNLQQSSSSSSAPTIADLLINQTLEGPSGDLGQIFLKQAHLLAQGNQNVSLKIENVRSPGDVFDGGLIPKHLQVNPANLYELSSKVLSCAESAKAHAYNSNQHGYENKEVLGFKRESGKGILKPSGKSKMDDNSTKPQNTRSNKKTPGTKNAKSQRYLTAKTKQQVELGETFPLVIQVAGVKPSLEPGSSDTPFPPIAGKITISVHGSGVEFLDGSMHILDVPVSGDSSPLLFQLKATNSGRHRLEIMAWNSSAHVAGLTLYIEVDTIATDLPIEKSEVNMRPPEKGEYTLEIIYERELNRYRFQLRGDTLGTLKPTYSQSLTGPNQTQYHNLLSSLNANARNLNGLNPADQYYWLRGLGTFMAQYLMPLEMHDALWELRDQINRMNILCDGDAMPWELLYITSPKGGDGYFLAEVAGVARWRYGPSAPYKLKIVHPVLVHPKGSPTHTANEINKLKVIFPKAQIVEDISELLKLLEKGNFGLLHFASHNNLTTDDASASNIPFGNSKFDLVFMGNIGHNKYKDASPLVFMNACTSAGRAPLFTEMSSWADRYLYSGAGSFVGSLWEIRDQSAPEFAYAFYEKLFGGSTLGEAMSAGRSAISANNPGDPTRLAYTLYGNPLAKIENA